MVRLLAAAGVAAVLLVAAIVLSASRNGSTEARVTALGPRDSSLVLYTVGASTDPYRDSSPGGFGVARLREGRFVRVAEVRDDRLGWFEGAEWLDERRVLVPQAAPPFRRRVVYRADGSRLVRERLLPLPPRDTTAAASPGGRWIASEPVEACRRDQESVWECYRQTGTIYLQRPDGSGRRHLTRGHLGGWTPDGRLLVTSVDYNQPYAALDVESGERALPLEPETVASFAGTDGPAIVGVPRWSADGRFVAARVSARWPAKATVAAIVIADARGRPIRLLRSEYVISMFAWSPRGQRLAYTTSGFPDPHELFVLDAPGAPARRVLQMERHFDWISWAPDSRSLVLDDAVEDLWWLVPTQPPYAFVTSPRLGGRPLWCCPVNSYASR